MRKIRTRILSLLLCAAMLIGMVPGTAYAAEEETAETVAETTTTEPAVTETVATEPAETEPAETEPAETAETEPATEPVETEPAETEPEETVETEPKIIEQEMEVYSSGSCGPGLSWTMDSRGNLAISGRGKMNDFRYPDVTPWDDLAVNSVVIKEGVTSIGYRAFSDCRYMLSIALPKSLTTINSCFYDNPWLSEIHYAGTPGEFEKINGKSYLEDMGGKQVIDWHFRSPGRNEYDYFPKRCGNNVAWSLDLETSTLTISGTGEMWDRYRYHIWDAESDSMKWKSPWNSIQDRISSVVITDGVTSVGSYVFYDWGNLMNVELPDSITRIGDGAFTACNLMSIPSFPSALTYIGDSAFGLCRSLTNKIYLPKVTYIGDSAFDSCRALSELTISQTGVKICEGAFWDCPSLKKVVLPEGASIGKHAFSSCAGLRELVIPDGVTKLGDSAFSYCTALKSVTLPRSLTDVGKAAFEKCSALTDVYYQGNKKDREGINIVQPNTELESARWHYAMEEETTVPVYRLYNAYSQEHLFVSSKTEYDNLGAAGWVQEGVAWNAPADGDPVYRLYNPYTNGHFYTLSVSEKNQCVANGWKEDGVLSHSASPEDGLPIFRLFNPYEKMNPHHYTISVSERDNLVSFGWKYEGPAWFAAK